MYRWLREESRCGVGQVKPQNRETWPIPQLFRSCSAAAVVEGLLFGRAPGVCISAYLLTL